MHNVVQRKFKNQKSLVSIVLFRSLSYNDEAILLLEPMYFAPHAAGCILYNKTDFETEGDFMSEQGVGHVNGTNLLEGNHLKRRIV